jgi:hypothetical protein
LITGAREGLRAYLEFLVRRYSLKVEKEGSSVIGILIAVLFAALVYFICTALGLPVIVGIVAAVLVLLAGVPTGGYGLGARWDGPRRPQV